LLEWFNDQYSSTIHAVPAVFVEFMGPLKFETMRHKAQQAPMVVRIHLVSKVLMQQDHSIAETSIAAHDALSEAIYEALQGFSAQTDEGILFGSLTREDYELHQYLKGWMVTTQDFAGMLYRHQQLSRIKKPGLELTIE
jgi:hypothetical protein